MYGLDAILSMHFLIPIVCVAKDLNWTGHELSDRIEELSQLDETCLLAAVHGMYAYKRGKK